MEPSINSRADVARGIFEAAERLGPDADSASLQKEILRFLKGVAAQKFICPEYSVTLAFPRPPSCFASFVVQILPEKEI